MRPSTYISLGQWLWLSFVGPLAIPEVRGLNPGIGKIYIEHLFTVNCIEKTKRKKKRPGMAHFFKKNLRVIIITDRLRNLKALINGLIVPWLRHPRHTSTTINLIIIF